MKIRTKLGLGFGAQIILATVLGVTVLVGMLEVKRLFRVVVEHDAPVIANAWHLSKLVVDMETGQRGFCITRQEEFLEPYHRGVKDFDVLIDTEKALVGDNPEQVACLERIEQLVHDWQQKAARPEIAMARKVASREFDSGHLREVLILGVGKRLMDRIMTLAQEIEVAFSKRSDWEGAFAAEVIKKCMADKEDGQRGFLITGDNDFLEKYDGDEQRKLPKWFARLRAIISDREREDELFGKVDRLELLIQEWTEKAAEPEIAVRREMNRHPETLRDVAALLEAGTGKALLDEIRREFDDFIEIETTLAAQRYNSASNTTVWIRNLTLGLLVFAILVGVAVALQIGRAIIQPLEEVACGAEAVGRGDIDIQIDATSSDEIGVLAKAFNAMTSNLKEAAFMRCQAEEALREAKGYTDNILKSMTDILAVVSPDGQLHTVNDACCSLLGYQAKELIGQPASLLFAEEDLEENYTNQFSPQHTLPIDPDAHCQLVKDDSVTNLEKLLLTKSGKKIPILLSAAVMRDDNDMVRGFVFVALDITARKRAENAQAEAKRLAEVATQAKSEFLANMSHEIRTPMTAILGFSDIPIEGATTREQRDVAETIRQNGEYLLEIINDILDLSKIEAGKLEVEQRPISPCQILSEVVSLMQIRATAKNLELSIEYDGTIPQTIHSDPTRLRQILINLIGNAIKFTEIGEVRLVVHLLSAGPEEARIQIEVIDTGIGMTEEQVDKLFRPFCQLDSSTTRTHGGTGLGLAISKRLAENLGGDITVRSRLGEGTSFTVTIGAGSLQGVTLLDDPTRTLKATEMDAPTTALTCELNCRVLVAEDGPDNQRLIAFLLKRAGADVTVAENGQIAIELALQARDEGYPFDVILMDMQMPVLDGYVATRKLREAGFTCPIVALTAHAMSGDGEKCLAAGCDDYATKPIDRTKLITMVSNHVARVETAISPHQQSSDTQL